MKMYLVDQAGRAKEIGNSKDLPVPRLGEGIVLGYTPCPLVTTVIYDFENDKIIIEIDGFIFN